MCTTREVLEEGDQEDQSEQVNIQMSGSGSFHMQVNIDHYRLIINYSKTFARLAHSNCEIRSEELLTPALFSHK